MTGGIDAPLVAHDEPLVDDTVFDLRLNHVWRRIVGEILIHAMDYIAWSGSTAEIEQANNWYSEMIADFYNETVGGGEMAYVGAQVSRTSDVTITGDTPVVFDNDFSDGSHDPDGFWQVSQADALTVPTGLAGWYFVYGYLQWGGSVETAVMTLNRHGASFLMFQKNFTLNVQAHQMPMSAVVQMGENDQIRMNVLASGAGRDLIIGGLPYSARLGMYRVGL